MFQKLANVFVSHPIFLSLLKDSWRTGGKWKKKEKKEVESPKKLRFVEPYFEENFFTHFYASLAPV